MRALLSSIAILSCLAACGSGGALEPSVPLYKTMGSVQCSGGGVTLAQLERQLTDANVRVLASACGADGNVHPAVCGAPDGAIGIFDIPAAQVPLALSLAFAPLSDLAEAVRVPCR